MKAVKPPVSSCNSRSRVRCSIRSASVSMPFVGQGFPFGQLFAHAIDQDFPSSPGKRAETRIFESAEHFTQRQLVDLVKVPDFRWAEAVDVDLGIAAFDIPQKLFVPFQLQLGVHASLEQDLISPCGDGFLDLAIQFLTRQDVGIRIVGFAVEGAEITDRSADIRVIDVAVDIVSAVWFRMQTQADAVGGLTQANQVVTAEQFEPFLRCQAIAVHGFAQNPVEIAHSVAPATIREREGRFHRCSFRGGVKPSAAVSSAKRSRPAHSRVPSS
jgi:hypothetical protein